MRGWSSGSVPAVCILPRHPSGFGGAEFGSCGGFGAPRSQMGEATDAAAGAPADGDKLQDAKSQDGRGGRGLGGNQPLGVRLKKLFTKDDPMNL